MSDPKHRPVFLDLWRIWMPVTAITSLGHRITGVLLFLALPFLLYLLEMSLRGPGGFEWVRGVVGGWPVKLLLIGVAWWYGHHFLAGIRHLLLDADVGTGLAPARRSAWWVNIGGLLVLLIAAVVIL
jgi:succinate dehydrogenase / fumarate reductase cytochrome b subunit